MTEYDFAGTPYGLEETGGGALEDVRELHERVELLRTSGKLSDATLRDYFGDKRFEQIAESNALEGSTLDVGETQLAVLRGITITGHDPAYSRDAVHLANALERVRELAHLEEPTDLEQILGVHALILGDRDGAGRIRTEPIRIKGSDHRPPKTWDEVMTEMESLESWSKRNATMPALLRAVVLHTWLTHIHPFIDGNGRTARAILNLELIRAGIPSVIIRRKDRSRYLDALADSDAGGDLGPVLDLITARAQDALRDLERSAARHQDYDEAAARLRGRQERQLAIWTDATKLVFSLLEAATQEAFGTVGEVKTKWYDDTLPLDDFIALCEGDPAGNAWLFQIEVSVPAVGSCRYLAWTGYRSYDLQRGADVTNGPAVFWSVPDPTGHRRWLRDDRLSPGAAEMTLALPNVDRWIVRTGEGRIDRVAPTALVSRIIRDIEKSFDAPEA